MGEVVPVWELWNDLRARLSTARMERLLGGAGRVYLGTDDYSEPEGAEDAVWGRVVLVPTATLWRADFVPNETRKVGFLVRAEVHQPPLERDFNPQRSLDAIHVEASNLLNGYTPAPYAQSMVALPVYQWSQPQPAPLLDEARGLLYTSSEYRTEVAHANGAL